MSDVNCRVVIAEDHPFVRLGISQLLQEVPGLSVVGETGNGLEAVALAKDKSPDVVITDLTLPGLGGLEIVQRVRKAVPKCRILVLSMHTGLQYVARALDAGASAYVLKDSAPHTLLDALNTVRTGGVYLSESICRASLDACRTHARKNKQDAFDSLSPREREILNLVAEGLNNPEIATRLFLGSRTVETHRRNIQRKLGLKSQAEVVRAAVRYSLLTGANGYGVA